MARPPHPGALAEDLEESFFGEHDMGNLKPEPGLNPAGHPGKDISCRVCGIRLRWIAQPFPNLSGWEACPLHAAAIEMYNALHTIAYEPIGEATASTQEIYDRIVEIARAALPPKR